MMLKITLRMENDTMMLTKILGLFLALAMLPAMAATDAEFVDLSGKKVKLSDYRGKWVIVNYWATWCPPCVHEIPELAAFHEAHKDKDAVVLGVNHEDDETTKVKQFVEGYLVGYPVLRSNERLSNRTPFGALKGLPTTYMITPEGELVAARTGMVDQKGLEKFIKDNSN
jgi:thiol-disulfide isomerase/thioredoxin